MDDVRMKDSDSYPLCIHINTCGATPCSAGLCPEYSADPNDSKRFKIKKPEHMKPLADWTLHEVKEICASRENCEGCPFKRHEAYEYHPCRLHGLPYQYKLKEETI